jgi:drug/metabolite transporter (DMT)-like permease
MPDPSSAAPSGTGGSPNRLLGFGYAALSSACLTVLWTIIRHLADRLHPLEITFFSSLFALIVFTPWLIRMGPRSFHTRRLWTHVIRGTFNSGGILLWFTALTLMPLAQAAALNLMMPLMVTVGAMIFLGETVRLRRWLALASGALGALVVIRPGFAEVNIGVWLILISAIFASGQRLIAKSLVRTDPSTTCVAYLLVVMTPITLVPALFVWQWPTPEEYLWLAAIGALLTAGHFTLVASLRLADISALEPVGFTRLVWSAILGFVFFAEVPGLWTWIGGAMIVGATTYLARREAQLKVATPKEKEASVQAVE